MVMIHKLWSSMFAVAAVIMAGVPAEAASLVFRYNFASGDSVSGILDGNLQDDGDTFFVDGVQSARFNGENIWPDATTAVARSSSDFPDGALQPMASLSGTVVDFLVCNPFIDGNCNFLTEGGLFLDNTSNDAFSFQAGAGNGRGSNIFEEIYEPNRWTASVPEPATILGSVILLGLGGAMQRKFKVSSARRPD